MRWIGRHAPGLLGHIHQPVHLPAVPVLARAVVIGRMPGWQIALIAVAALAAVAVARFVDRARAGAQDARGSGGRGASPAAWPSRR